MLQSGPELVTLRAGSKRELIRNGLDEGLRLKPLTNPDLKSNEGGMKADERGIHEVGKMWDTPTSLEDSIRRDSNTTINVTGSQLS